MRTHGHITSEVTDEFLWGKVWAQHLPHRQLLDAKVVKPPTSFVAGKRSFSKSGYIQSELRTTAVGKVPEGIL